MGIVTVNEILRVMAHWTVNNETKCIDLLLKTVRFDPLDHHDKDKTKHWCTFLTCGNDL